MGWGCKQGAFLHRRSFSNPFSTLISPCGSKAASCPGQEGEGGSSPHPAAESLGSWREAETLPGACGGTARSARSKAPKNFFPKGTASTFLHFSAWQRLENIIIVLNPSRGRRKNSKSHTQRDLCWR